MRDLRVPTISFTDSSGKTYAIKDKTEYPTYVISQILPISKYDNMDEIGTRREIYGDDSEEDIYKIIEANITELFEASFDLSKLRSLRIPVR